MSKVKFFALPLALAICGNHAFASESGFYAGAGIGQSTVSNWFSKDDMLGALDYFGDEMGVVGFNGSVAASSDDQDTGWKIYGGYQFTPNFAIEAAYIDLGSATAKSSATGIFNVGFGNFPGSLYVKTEAEATAFVVDAVAKAPVANWVDLFVKGGLYRAEIELKVTAGATDSGGRYEDSDTEKDSSAGLHFGLGADFNVAKNFVIRTEWESLRKVDFQDDDTDLSLLSISAAYKF